MSAGVTYFFSHFCVLHIHLSVCLYCSPLTIVIDSRITRCSLYLRCHVHFTALFFTQFSVDHLRFFASFLFRALTPYFIPPSSLFHPFCHFLPPRCGSMEEGRECQFASFLCICRMNIFCLIFKNYHFRLSQRGFRV
jgi:hypothetical protein